MVFVGCCGGLSTSEGSPTSNLSLRGGKVKAKIDGVDLMPLLKGGELKRKALFWHYPHYPHYPHYRNQGGFPLGAVRMGDWKLVERYEDGRVHLYNLKDDSGELKGLQKGNEALVKSMRAKLHAWNKETDAKFLQPKKGQKEKPWRP